MNYSNYRIIHELGQGGMAKVYLAEHKTLGHKVAIKVLNKEYFHNANIRKRFLAEARSLAGMNHPNIVRVTDLIEENESAAFVMEHIEGRTLREYLEEKGKLSDDEIKHLFGQMLDAVGYVHEKGLVHRDIKPSNFMLDGRGNIKLLDFGIAKAQDITSSEYTQTGTGVQMGTPMYMSPEQVKESRSVTAQSDIYSLGVVLWQMVAGKKPYDVTTLSDFDMKTKIVNEALKETGSRWDTEIQIATSKEISKRYKSCTDWKNNVNGKQHNPKENQVKETERTIVDTGRVNPIEKPKQNTNSAILIIGLGIFLFVVGVILWLPNNTEQKDNTISEAKNVPIKSEYPIKDTSSSINEVPSGSQSLAVESVPKQKETRRQISRKGLGVKAVDGTSYKTILIGNQEWMAENLRVITFNDGTDIGEYEMSSSWAKLKEPGWCYYDNNSSIGNDGHGILYNWYCVESKKLCPIGWHVPSFDDWMELEEHLGGRNIGNKLKIGGQEYWNESNTSLTNKYGFSALPSGYRTIDGNFYELGVASTFWLSSLREEDNRLAIGISFQRDWSTTQEDARFKGLGASVRCIKD